ncbi:hypothetical protein ACLBW0_14440 [Enterobacteriaceae bacterium C34A]
MKKVNKEVTLLKTISGMIFYAGAFFAFIFIVSNVGISLYYRGKIDLEIEGLKHLGVLSCMIGVIAGGRLWIYAWLDKRKL